MIKITKLNKLYNKNHVLKDINLTFPNKGLISIVGPSGCGKSTLLNSIAALLDYDGKIEIDGYNYSFLSEQEKTLFRLKNIGFVFQDFKLFEKENIQNNMLLPLISLSKMTSHQKKIKAIELLEAVELNKNVYEKVSNLSGGQKQKVAIARAIVNKPKIILCDEPTGSLDNKNKHEIMKILSKLSNVALVILVSHDLSLIKQYSDRIISLSDGRVIKDQEFKRNKNNFKVLLKEPKKKLDKDKIPCSFIFSHILQKIKTKKYRTSIVVGVMSVGLLMLGFSLNLSNSIANNIKSSFASVINEQRVIVTKRNNESQAKTRMAASWDDVYKIYTTHNSNFSGIGANYIADYESLFPDINEIF